MLNEFVARHTYDEFIQMLKPGAKALHKKQILEAGYGYDPWVQGFRYFLKKFGLKEKDVVKEFSDIPISCFIAILWSNTS
jgi:hypothetical protein